MMKRYLFISMVLIFALGCVSPIKNLGCCARANITEGCAMFNTTTGYYMEEYIADTNWCNETMGYCNVTFEGEETLIPICTDTELTQCINPDCVAMICGDFVFKPKVAPGVLAPEGDEPGAQVDIPPESEDEEETVAFYKAQCRFFPMDPKLKSIMKNSKGSINVFRIGVGGSFEEYDTYRYYFPLSDKYCNVNPGFGAEEQVDRYMNYLGYSGGSVAYDASEIGECMESPPEEPFRFGHDSLVSTPAGDVYGERFEYHFDEYYKLLYEMETDSPPTSCYGESYWTEASPYRKLSKEYYREELSREHIETIFGAGRAPFECAGPQDCYSGTCSFDFYSRGANVKEVGGETVEFSADCNIFSTPEGRQMEICSAATGINPGDPDPIDYGQVSINIAKIKIEVDGYNSGQMLGVEEKAYPGECPNVHIQQWTMGCIGDCEGKGSNSNHRCELRNEWCDFTGSDLGAYECSANDISKTVRGTLRYDHDKQMVSQGDIKITRMPAGIVVENREKRDCEHFYGENSETSTVECPVLIDGDYPPAGGFVFFGKRQEGEEVKWNEKTVIGYALVDSMPTTTLGSECGLGGHPYEVIEIGAPNSANWQKLMDTFTPLFEERIDSLAGEMGDGVIDDGEIIISSIPWILAYKKWSVSSDDRYTMNSIAAQKLAERNLFDLPTPNAGGTSAAELDANSLNSKAKSKNKGANYLLVYPKYIYLIFEPSSEGGDLGTSDCDYDEASGLPSIRQYGWCEPCTISTLAYQNISAADWAYMPMKDVRVASYGEDEENICTCTRDSYEVPTINWYCIGIDCHPMLGYVTEYRHIFDCYSPYITDMDDYIGVDITSTGAARTQPEASLMKERLGNYMKSGVLPVIDMTDASNWNRTTPYDDDVLYSEYDFQKLFGDMGAVITIVDTVPGDETVTSEDINQVAQRASIIRTYCWRCLTAVRISAPYTNESFNETLTTLFSDFAIRNDIDMVAFDYSPNEIGVYSSDDPAEQVLEYMKYFGTTALRLTQKPSIILNFHIAEGGFWTLGVIEDVFNTISTEQDELVDSGITGIIYMPARENLIEGEGIVAVDSSGVGDKGDKFCTVQKGMNAFATPPPTVVYSRIATVNETNCTRCSSYEKAIGACDRMCENGIECTLPDGPLIDPDDYTCPTGTILDPCQLCNETSGDILCEYRYHNGTVREVTYDPSDISSDFYMDVIGGLEKPDVCCLEAQDGSRYSYTQQVISGTANVPIVFPKAGAEGARCSTSGVDIASAGGFCGLEVVPVKNYEVSCRRVP